MSLTPSPSAARGDLILQPAYFTSSLYVDPFRADVQNLIDRFDALYATASSQPFSLFKRIWDEEGWPWMLLKVFDSRTRDVFLRVSCRLFVGMLKSTI